MYNNKKKRISANYNTKSKKIKNAKQKTNTNLRAYLLSKHKNK